MQIVVRRTVERPAGQDAHRYAGCFCRHYVRAMRHRCREQKEIYASRYSRRQRL